jgi:hypothetical protein
MDIIRDITLTFLELVKQLPPGTAIAILTVGVWGAFGWFAWLMTTLDNRLIRRQNMELHGSVSRIYKGLHEERYKTE